MTADQGLQQLLADTDAALPPPPARGLTAAALHRRLARRRRTALLAGATTIAMALGTAGMLRRSTRVAEATAAAELAAVRATVRARFTELLARVEGLRSQGSLEADRCRAELAVERAAVAGVQCAAGLDAFDPAAAARQRAQIAALHPDTFAARNLAAVQLPQEHRAQEHR